MNLSRKSIERLGTCDTRLQNLVYEIVKTNGVYVLCGHRGKEEQNKAYYDGKSKLLFPKSKHNKCPSLAVDLAPAPLPDWEDTIAFLDFSSIVLSTADHLNYEIRWGGDWDMDGETEQNEWDYVHYEIV